MARGMKFERKLQMLGVAVLAAAVPVLVWVASRSERALVESRMTKTRHLVEAAAGVVRHHVELAKAGSLPQEEAQARAIATLRGMRYDGKEYFWVNDMTPRMVMHPFKPELEGQDLRETADPNGKRLFVAFVDEVRANGSGFVPYEWPKPGLAKPVPKISYVTGVTEWGWVVGSGIYLDDVNAAIARQRTIVGIALALLVLVCLSVTGVFAHRVTRDLQAIAAAAARAEKGDLRAKVDLRRDDELGALGQAINHMLESFSAALAETREAALASATSARELTASSASISSGAQEQASSLEETASALEQISSTVRQNADNAAQAAQLARGAHAVAGKGGEVVAEAVQAMGQINASSRRIADILTAIDEIAFQTNLLALNAAVEAARAGEQGRGFAVVASEVRNLAQRSASSAKEIKNLIEDSEAKVRAGTELVNRSGQTLEEIVAAVRHLTDLVGEIATASREQSSGIEQVSLAIAQMDQVTQSNAAQTEELAGTAESLSAKSEKLEELVSRFQLAQG